MRAYARALLNPNTMAATIRKTIGERKRITDRELREIMRRDGYNPDGGAYTAVLYVLDKVTGEVRRIGRGKDKVYEWVALA